MDVITTENIAIIKSNKLSIKEDRFVVIDIDTGELLDDGSGYGYKSEEKAQKSFNFKKHYYQTSQQDLIKVWLNNPQNDYVMEEVYQKCMGLGRHHKSFTLTNLTSILDRYGYNQLPFSPKDLFRYIEENGI